MKFVSDLPQVGGFLQVLHHDLTEILLKTVLNNNPGKTTNLPQITGKCLESKSKKCF
jgi:hypothetical protein